MPRGLCYRKFFTRKLCTWDFVWRHFCPGKYCRRTLFHREILSREILSPRDFIRRLFKMLSFFTGRFCPVGFCRGTLQNVEVDLSSSAFRDLPRSSIAQLCSKLRKTKKTPKLKKTFTLQNGRITIKNYTTKL